MIKFLKKLFGIGADSWAPVDEIIPAPVTEEEKVLVVEKKVSKAKLPKKEKAVRSTQKREKPVTKATKAEPPTKKRGRPAKKK